MPAIDFMPPAIIIAQATHNNIVGRTRLQSAETKTLKDAAHRERVRPTRANKAQSGDLTMESTPKNLSITINKYIFYSIIALGSILLLALIIIIKHPAEARTIIASVYDVEAGKVNRDETRNVGKIYKISTPHKETISDLLSNGENLTEEQKKYYYADDKVLSLFAKDLQRLGAQGYSRVESWGSGSMSEKRQWLWTVTWPVGSNISIDKIAKAYQYRFHRNNNIYIEETTIGNTLYTTKK